MKEYWATAELNESWKLSKEELLCVNSKSKSYRLGYAIKMRFIDMYGYFPNHHDDISDKVTSFIASQITNKSSPLKEYPWNKRLSQLHDAEIRKFYGYKKFNDSHWKALEEYLSVNFFSQGEALAQAKGNAFLYLKNNKIEFPSEKMLERKIRSMHSTYESDFFKKHADSITINGKKSLKKFLKYEEDGQTTLSFLRKVPGKISKNTINEELKKLKYLVSSSVLYKDFFKNTSRQLIQKYHDKVSVMTPSALSKLYHKDENKFYTMLACFSKYKGSKIIDNIAEIFIRRFHRVKKTAKARAKNDVFDYYTKSDKEELLNNLVDISLEYPEELIKEKIYEGVGGKEALEASKATRSTFKHNNKVLEYKHMSSLYSKHHRSYFLRVLKEMNLHSNTENIKLEATQHIINNFENKDYKLEHKFTKDFIPPLDAKVIKEQTDAKARKMYSEIATLAAFRKELRCKNIWLKGSFKYNDPEEELPKDFERKKKHYCKTLGISEDAQVESLKLKQEMKLWMKKFNDNIVGNPSVRIAKKGKKPHIFITPYEPQDEPSNLKALKEEIASLWPGLGLLDILKEVDLRVGLTSELIDLYGKTPLAPTHLRQRLLMCLFSMGTNTELNKVCLGASDISAEDLRYTKKRVISPEILRHIIKKLVNKTLEIRDKEIWGEVNNTFASDSTKFASWSNNLMTEYHIRYKGNGIMAYWHIERKALCIASQTIRCSDSEVAVMLRGIIHHATNAKVEKHSTDTHGQSLVAFAFAYIIGVDLRPRIKGIGRLKLYKADPNIPKSNYNNIKSVVTRSINWNCFEESYDTILKCAIALKSKTAEPEALLKRFISDNLQSPVYKAVLELGRAARTIFMCKYFISDELKQEVEEALNVVENWHSGNGFIFFGKRGVISSNDEIDHELSVLALHLLQSSLVYINTLMIQQVLKKHEWKNRLTIEDKRALTPLFYNHINQYGVYNLDMNTRINIEDR